jgi:hypothetical protein
MKLTVLGKELLGLYFSEPHKKVKGTEIPFVVPIVSPQSGQRLPISLEGVIDLIEEEDAITEFKTSAQVMDQKEVEGHLQLTVYSYAYEMLVHRSPKLLRVVDFVKSRKPKMIVLKTGRGKADYERFFCLAGQVLRGIRSQVFFPRAGFWCKDCEYGEHCRSWGGG